MPAIAGYNAKLLVNGVEVFYTDISPNHKGDSIDTSRTGVDARAKRRIVGQIAADLPVSMVWFSEDNPNDDPPNFVVGAVLTNCRWYPDRNDTGYFYYSALNVVGTGFKGALSDAIRYEVSLESDGNFYWVPA